MQAEPHIVTTETCLPVCLAGALLGFVASAVCHPLAGLLHFVLTQAF